MADQIIPEYSFRVSPRVLAPLGMEQLQDPALAVLELVKNSWDASATRVWIEIVQNQENRFVSVRDNGTGMSVSDFHERWLVIGKSEKRDQPRAFDDRPLIGEKGLGRLAAYALGSRLHIESATKGQVGFETTVDWDEMLRCNSIEDYKIRLARKSKAPGTRVVIDDLRGQWTDESTDFLTTHAQFLTSVPGQRFAISLKVDGKKFPIQDPLDAIARIAEGELDVAINASGLPLITRCVMEGVDLTESAFRDFDPRQIDARLSGTRISLKFYRRDKASKKLAEVLSVNEVNDALERYQGVRIYRDGINVPPYGLNGDDWAAVEKQRTATGGPTMVPGNSQLTGEVWIPKSAKHFVITAGRSGFADQAIVRGLAAYVKWAVKELGTARRARILGISPGEEVPNRVDPAVVAGRAGDSDVRNVLQQIKSQDSVRRDPELRKQFAAAQQAVVHELDRSEQTLRLYAQLASTGIAATSFAHELRADFDVVSEAVVEIGEAEIEADDELVSLLTASWSRIASFAALFRLLPVKARRRRSLLTPGHLKDSVEAVGKLAPADKIRFDYKITNRRVQMVPAELDSILLNLVSNSVKAVTESSKSTGKVRVALLDTGDSLEIRVADNGCGVPKKVAAVMFEPLEGKFSEGTGMGLPIVRFIAQRYGGDVALSPSPPAGYATEFRVVLRGVVK